MGQNSDFISWPMAFMTLKTIVFQKKHFLILFVLSVCYLVLLITRQI